MTPEQKAVLGLPCLRRLPSLGECRLIFGGGASQPEIDFHSNWDTENGAGSDAIRDTDKPTPWTMYANALYDQLNIESAEGIFNTAFPACMTVRIQLAADQGIDAQFANVIYDGINPQVDDELSFRFYMVHALDDSEYHASWATSWAGNHGIELQDSTGDGQLLIKWNTTNNGKWDLWFTTKSEDGIGTKNWHCDTQLDKDTEYRIEFQVKVLSTTTYNLHVWIYDESGVLLYDDDDFTDGSDSLGDTPTINGWVTATTMLDKFDRLKMGHNASQTLYLASPGSRLVDPCWHWAALAFSKAGQVGAYMNNK
jgi:hypothetical protein